MAAPEGNKNAEKWTLKESTKFLERAIVLSEDKKYDFIGEVARHQKSYIEIYEYLVDKFEQLRPLLKRLKRNCEANCFSNAKASKIVPSIAIMNLKSNHGWTDRVDNTTKGEKISTGEKVKIVFKDKSKDK